MHWGTLIYLNVSYRQGPGLRCSSHKKKVSLPELRLDTKTRYRTTGDGSQTTALVVSKGLIAGVILENLRLRGEKPLPPVVNRAATGAASTNKMIKLGCGACR